MSGVVGRPSLRSGSDQEALPKIWEWLVGPHELLKVVGRPSRRLGSG